MISKCMINCSIISFKENVTKRVFRSLETDIKVWLKKFLSEYYCELILLVDSIMWISFPYESLKANKTLCSEILQIVQTFVHICQLHNFELNSRCEGLFNVMWTGSWISLIWRTFLSFFIELLVNINAHMFFNSFYS